MLRLESAVTLLRQSNPRYFEGQSIDSSLRCKSREIFCPILPESLIITGSCHESNGSSEIWDVCVLDLHLVSFITNLTSCTHLPGRTRAWSLLGTARRNIWLGVTNPSQTAVLFSTSWTSSESALHSFLFGIWFYVFMFHHGFAESFCKFLWC